MRRRAIFTTLLLSLFLCASPFALAQEEVSRRVAPAVVTILARNGAGRFEVVGSGVFVRSDGVLLTAYNLVQGGRELQVRLSNGETYDKVEVIASDERRNVAALRVYAINTPFVSVGMTDEASVGAQVRAIYQGGNQLVTDSPCVLSSIGLADEIPGAGTGFRVLKFTAPVPVEATGGILVDNYGRVLGLIAPLSRAESRNYAVPVHAVAGMVSALPISQPPGSSPVYVPGTRDLSRAVPVYQSSTTPLEQMPQVSMPQRPTSPLRPAGPGSAVVRETDPAKLLASSKTLYITSRSNVFKSVQLLNELRKKHEFTDWNMTFVDDLEVADLILEVEHVVLTWEFPFSIKHQRTGVVIATGKIYAWGGGDGAQLMASRVVERLTRLRAAIKPENKPEK